MTASHPAAPIRHYRMALSGHCHRVELLLSLLGLPYENVDVDLAAREHKSPAFLARNRFGQVPVIEDGEITLADSNAIMVYLEARYAPGRFMPRDPAGAARVQRWLSVAARIITLFRRADDPQPAIARAQQLFGVMEAELAERPWLAGTETTLADLANYAYVARAPEGNVSLQDYPALRAWLQRIEALPGFVPFVKSPVGLPA